MTAVAISLLGGFAVEVKSNRISAFESNKVRALLAYLTVEASGEGARSHQRSVLAGLLWPDCREEVARTNLRHVLRQLRQTLPAPTGSPPLLLATQQTIQINPDCSYTLDVARFTQLLAAVRRCPHRALVNCLDCLARYKEAAHLYRGAFLAGFTLDDSEPFDQWVAVQRERLHRQALALFYTLAAHHEGGGEYEQAQHYATRQIELEPWREEAHRQLMRVLARRGQWTAALTQFTHCRQTLIDELGVEPTAETVALYEAIRTGRLEKMTRWSDDKMNSASDQPVSLSPSPPVTPVAHQDWGEAPALASFYGRQTEMATLHNWLREEQCRVIAVLGMGGMGKTSLVRKVAQAVSTDFDLIFWRSLLNAPPLTAILHPLLQLLLPSGEVQLPTTLPEQLSLLFAQLRTLRCLLVFDNLESILEPGEAGRYRPGHEAYGQLLHRLGQGDHQSCLILTSRERPAGVGRMEDDLLPVRTLRLAGLAPEAGRALLKGRGIDDDRTHMANLVACYSGNPLALKLVTRTIHDLFDGDISAFLSDEAPIFDDIRTVLDQQFGRLTPLEQELLLWLAVEREAITLDRLAQNLVQRPLRRNLLEALLALQRRSLLEKHANGFTLQNVVTEYLTDCLVEQACQEIADGQIVEWQDDRVSDAAHSHPITQSHLNRYALFKAQAKEYVRQSQVRLIVQPIVDQLTARLGRPLFIAQLKKITIALQQFTAGRAAEAPGYLGGNLLNLLLAMGVDLTGVDFSHLCLWQAFLRGKVLPKLNLSGADLSGAAFTYLFGNVQSLQFQADHELLIVGTSGDLACVWQARDGALRYAVPIQDPTYRFICFHADSGIAALGGPPYTIVLMNMVTAQIQHTLGGHRAPIWSRIFSPRGEWLASGDATGKVYLWAVASGERLGCLESHRAPITALAFAPDGHLLASGDVDGVVSLWHVPSGELIRTFQAHPEEVGALQFVLDNTALATGSYDRTICLWDLASGARRYELHGHTQPIRLLGAGADGQMFVSAGDDHFITVWDAHSGQTRHRLTDHAISLWHLGCRRDGKAVAALDANETLNVWDVESGLRTEVYRIYHNGIQAMAFSPDGKRLISGGGDGILYVWDVSTPTAAFICLQLAGHGQRVESVAVHPAGALLASGDRSDELRLWSLNDGASRRLHGGQGGTMALAFSPDGELVASAGADGSLDLWDVQSGQRRHRLLGHTNMINTCAFSPDGRWIVSGGVDRTVRLWNVADGTLRHTLQGHTNVVGHVDFCPDGQRIVSSSFDETVCLWDAHAGRLLTRWSAPNMSYISLDIHPDGALLAAGSYDLAIHLLALETGELLGELPGHRRSVEAIHFGPAIGKDVRLLASASLDETIRLWTVESAQSAAGVTVKAATCLALLRSPGPYAGMKISGVTGISDAQKAALRALGAVEE